MPDYLQEYIYAFNILTTRRQVGMTQSPLMLSEIISYIEIYDCTEPDIFVLHMIKLDVEYLTLSSKDKQNG